MRRGQSLWEYALVMVLASLAFISISTYFRRGVQGRIKDLTDSQVSSVQYVSGQSKADTATSSKVNLEVANVPTLRTTVSEEETTRKSTEYSTGEGWEDLMP